MIFSVPAFSRSVTQLIVIAIFVGVVSSGSGKGHSQAPEKAIGPAIKIFDSNGRLVPNISPSATNQTIDVTVAPGGARSFSPDSVSIFTGDTVRWTWDGSGHNVTSGASCNADSQFCSPTDTNCGANPLSNMGTIYSHTFGLAGTYSYFCSAHCGSGMTGTVNVSIAPLSVTSISRSGTGAIVVTGQTAPNLTVTIKGSADLVTFATIGTATANGSGVFSFPDTAPLIKRFYRATYP
jgi:plastocyanin